MAPKELNFITGNANKLAEVKAILADSGVELRSQNVDLVEVQGTVEEVTLDKCKRAAEQVSSTDANTNCCSIDSSYPWPPLLTCRFHQQVGGPVLVEDTCLCFKAMNDLPGPYM